VSNVEVTPHELRMTRSEAEREMLTATQMSEALHARRGGYSRTLPKLSRKMLCPRPDGSALLRLFGAILSRR